MDEAQRILIQEWKSKGTEAGNQFVRFFIFYMCLDAWISIDSLAESDRKKINWVTQEENHLKRCWQRIKTKQEVIDSLNVLKNIGKVENMQPTHRGEIKKLENVHNFDQVFRFIYQIRCNLFHGGKSSTNLNDVALVTASGNILKIWLEEALITYRRSND